MKTFGIFLYRLIIATFLVLTFCMMFQIYTSLEKIVTELRISNEMTMCIEDPNCKLDNEM